MGDDTENGAEATSIPIIDLSSEKDEAALAIEVVDTFKTIGFATLINHGVEASTIEKGFAAGFPLSRYYQGMDNSMLIAVTEKRTRQEIGMLAEALEAIL